MKLHLIFNKTIRSVNDNTLFDRVEFTTDTGMISYELVAEGVSVYFSDRTKYTYPWHCIDRVKEYN